ncbi:MAG TPA: threonine--tRNA ligase [Deinococcales bacterium]|nr:threonine--tRNA ligase [Deinococcales bacterium]
MQVVLPDGKQLDLPAAATALDAAAAIGPRLAKDAIGARVNGKLTDVLTPLPDGAQLEIITTRKPAEAIDLARHTLAHVMAQAVVEHYRAKGFPRESVRMGIGPVIENGFYYDFDLPEPLGAEELPAVEERMRRIVERDLPLHRFEVTREQALAEFSGRDRFKTELIEGLPEGEAITFYRQGGEEDFTDLCRGPHVPRTGLIPPHFRLTSTSGAYWRGSEKNPMLQRIYGVAFQTPEELEKYLWQVEEAKRRDHRKLGKELDLFVLTDEVGQGLPLWLPKGAFIRKQLEDYMFRKEQEYGYQYVYTPHITKGKLYEISGHLEHYADGMYAPIDIEGEQYYLKPMNCPHHHMIFKARPKSYRELPVRYAEFGTVYRYELSGALSGLSRVRAITQNDAHIYCAESQVKDEFISVIRLFNEVYSDFGITDYWFRLSLPDFENNPEKFGANGPHWDRAIKAIRDALEETGSPYVEGIGEASFYGPKLDVQARTVVGKEESIATNQLDFFMSERFGLEFVNTEGERERPVIIHRAIMGSFDRFFAFYLEQTAGNFPVWLAPVQARIVPISDRHLEYARGIEARMKAAGLRPEVDDSSERMQAKIRDAELQKVPLILVVGDKEAAAGEVSVREHGQGDRGKMSVEALIGEMTGRVAARK